MTEQNNNSTIAATVENRKNEDVFKQMHPLRTRLSIEGKIYYLHLLHRLSQDHNHDSSSYVSLIGSTFGIPENVYTSAEISVTEHSEPFLNKLDRHSKIILAADGFVVDRSGHLFDMIDIDNDIKQGVTQLFDIMNKGDYSALLDFFESTDDFLMKDFLYLLEYHGIDSLAIQERHERTIRERLQQAENELTGIYRSLLLSKEHIQYQLERDAIKRTFRSQFSSDSLPFFSRYTTQEEMEEAEEALKIPRLKAHHRRLVSGFLDRLTSVAIPHFVDDVLLPDFEIKKERIREIIEQEDLLRDTGFKVNGLRINTAFQPDRIEALMDNPYPYCVPGKTKKKWFSSDYTTEWKIRGISDYKEYGRNALNQLSDYVATAIVDQLTTFVESEMQRVAAHIQQVRSNVEETLDAQPEFMDISGLDDNEATLFVKMLGLIVGVDNKISDNEKNMLRRLMDTMSLSGHVDELLDFSDREQVLEQFNALFVDHIARYNFLLEAYTISMADGTTIPPENQKMIDYCIKSLNISRKEADFIFQQAKSTIVH